MLLCVLLCNFPALLIDVLFCLLLIHKVLYNKAQVKNFAWALQLPKWSLCALTRMMSLQRIGVFLDLRLDIYLKSHQEMPPLKLPFFHLWTSPHFNALNHESESTGCQPV